MTSAKWYCAVILGMACTVAHAQTVCCGSSGAMWTCAAGDATCRGPLGLSCGGSIVAASTCASAGTPTPTPTPTVTPPASTVLSAWGWDPGMLHECLSGVAGDNPTLMLLDPTDCPTPGLSWMVVTGKHAELPGESLQYQAIAERGTGGVTWHLHLDTTVGPTPPYIADHVGGIMSVVGERSDFGAQLPRANLDTPLYWSGDWQWNYTYAEAAAMSHLALEWLALADTGEFFIIDLECGANIPAYAIPAPLADRYSRITGWQEQSAYYVVLKGPAWGFPCPVLGAWAHPRNIDLAVITRQIGVDLAPYEAAPLPLAVKALSTKAGPAAARRPVMIAWQQPGPPTGAMAASAQSATTTPLGTAIFATPAAGWGSVRFLGWQLGPENFGRQVVDTRLRSAIVTRIPSVWASVPPNTYTWTAEINELQGALMLVAACGAEPCSATATRPGAGGLGTMVYSASSDGTMHIGPVYPQLYRSKSVDLPSVVTVVGAVSVLAYQQDFSGQWHIVQMQRQP